MAGIGVKITEPGIAGQPLRVTLPGGVLAGDFLNFVSVVDLVPAGAGKTKAVITIDEVEVDITSPPVTI